MWRLTWRHYLRGSTAADSVHMADGFRRNAVTRVGCARAPVPRRRVVRRHDLTLVQPYPEVTHSFRQPGLGGLPHPPHGLLILLPLLVNTSQRVRSVRVSLPRRLVQQRHALIRHWRSAARAQSQGLTLVHFSANPEPFLAPNPSTYSAKGVYVELKKWTDVSSCPEPCPDPQLDELARSPSSTALPCHQGPTLVHFSAQLERLIWERGCA